MYLPLSSSVLSLPSPMIKMLTLCVKKSNDHNDPQSIFLSNVQKYISRKIKKKKNSSTHVTRSISLKIYFYSCYKLLQQIILGNLFCLRRHHLGWIVNTVDVIWLFFNEFGVQRLVITLSLDLNFFSKFCIKGELNITKQDMRSLPHELMNTLDTMKEKIRMKIMNPQYEQ